MLENIVFAPISENLPSPPRLIDSMLWFSEMNLAILSAQESENGLLETLIDFIDSLNVKESNIALIPVEVIEFIEMLYKGIDKFENKQSYHKMRNHKK